MPAGGAFPSSIAPGADGNLWFPQIFSIKVGRITTAGNITLIDPPFGSGDAVGAGITAGPDGNLWFSAQGKISIISLSPSLASSGLHDLTNTYSWSATSTAADGTAYQTFMAGVAPPGCFAGQCDWRLPTVAELQTIVADFACGKTFGGACSCTSFPCVQRPVGQTGQMIWAATTAAQDPTQAWSVDFSTAALQRSDKTTAFSTRAVRGGL